VDLLIKPFLANTFMLHALSAGLLVTLTCAIVGSYIILRGLAFIGDALAHGVLPGIALAILLGVPGMVGAGVGAAVMIGGISLITHRSRLSSDTAIGLLFVGMLALGVAIVSRGPSFTGDLVHVLFGEILGIATTDLWIQLVAALVVVVTALICRRPFLLLCFSPEQAEVAGFSVRLYHNLMLFLIALTIIVSFQTVGTMLVFGMLLAPTGAGALLARRIESMMLWAMGFGAAAVYLGLLASYHFDIAAGPAIVLVDTLLFFAVFTGQNRRIGRRSRLETTAL
jgi:ABC-type Mn2+/Zn2+ transport system permease subunit